MSGATRHFLKPHIDSNVIKITLATPLIVSSYYAIWHSTNTIYHDKTRLFVMMQRITKGRLSPTSFCVQNKIKKIFSLKNNISEYFYFNLIQFRFLTNDFWDTSSEDFELTVNHHLLVTAPTQISFFFYIRSR